MKCVRFLAVCALAVIARAQADVAIVADTDLTVSVPGDTRTILAGTDLSAGTSLAVTSSLPRCFGSASMTVAVTRGTNLSCTFDNRVTGGTTIPCGAGGSAGAHAILATFRSPTPIAGRLEIEAFPVQNGSDLWNTWSSAASADVNADGGGDLIALAGMIDGTPARLHVPVVLGPQGLAVRLHAAAAVVANLGTVTATGKLRITFQPGIFQLDSYGNACGPTLQASHLAPSRELRFVAAISLATSQWIVLGLQELDLPIPGTGCALRNEALIARPVIADSQGVARPVLALPPGFAAQFVVQHLAATPNGSWFDWHTSNGVRVRLP